MVRGAVSCELCGGLGRSVGALAFGPPSPPFRWARHHRVVLALLASGFTGRSSRLGALRRPCAHSRSVQSPVPPRGSAPIRQASMPLAPPSSLPRRPVAGVQLV
eukprot:5145704-Prymnesium_polylepis.1